MSDTDESPTYDSTAYSHDELNYSSNDPDEVDIDPDIDAIEFAMSMNGCSCHY